MNDHLAADAIDRSLVSGLAWTGALRWASQLFSWGATLYAARMLLPADFGLIAMAMVAIGLARMVQEFGLDSVLIQDRSLEGDTLARIAGFLVLFGLVLFAIYAAASTWIAGYFDEPRLALLIVALALLFVLDSIQIVPTALLQRRLQFRRQAIVMLVQAVATAVALILAIAMQLGVWSLVVSQLLGEVAVTILLLAWAPYRVALPRDWKRLAAPLLQAWRVLASRIAWYAQSNADQTIIGRTLGKELLGAYSFAVTFSSLAQREIASVVGRLVPGIFSEVQNDPVELRRYFLLLTEFLTLLGFPMAVGVALVADIVVPFVIGEQWSTVIAPLRWLCLQSVFALSLALVSHVLIWTGQFRLNMWLTILAGIVMVPALLIVAPFGLEAIGLTWAVSYPILGAPALYFACRTIRMSLAEWLNAVAPATVGCLFMSAAVLLARELALGGYSTGAQSILSIAIGALAYPAAVLIFFTGRVRRMVDFAMILRKRRSSTQVRENDLSNDVLRR